MKRISYLIILMAATSLTASAAFAQETDPIGDPVGPGEGNGVCQFIDEDGDGFNDLAPDHDGDGIPNGLDPDYVRPEDGTGNQYQHQFRYGFLIDVFGRGFGSIALDGNGGGHMFGVRDGEGTGFGPADGTGFGPGSGNSPGDGVGNGQNQGNSNGNGQGGQGGNR